MSAALCDAVASPNTSIDICKVVEWREAAERECARAPLIGIRFADGLSAGGYEGVGLGERKARTAKQPQGPAREPQRSEFLLLRGMLFH